MFLLLTVLLLDFSAGFNQQSPGIRLSASIKPSKSCLHLTTITPSTKNNGQDPLLPSSVYSTIEEGKIAIVPNFIPAESVEELRTDAMNLWNDKHFSTDALAGYGSTGRFDPSKDRAVLRLPKWKSQNLGNYPNRERFGNLMAQVRSELSYNLNRPFLDKGNAVDSGKFGLGSTEISYTRFGPGAFLKRHVDEHHEELKGIDGWSKPTRRSVSWLIYLNDQDWNKNGRKDGGELRCFERKSRPYNRSPIGASKNGDLQVGWLKATAIDPYERPVYLDAKTHNHGDCSMYILDSNNNSRTYISKTFETNPIMYVAGSEALVKRLLFPDDRKDLADRFHLIEPPKNKISDILKGDKNYAGWGLEPEIDEELEDVSPVGGTLVLFDSVSLPHEVLATKERERWACSGWMHEDQQPIQV